MFRPFDFIRRNEHRFSTLIFVVGFVTDILSFTLLDLPVVNLLFLGYLGIAAFFVFLAHAVGPMGEEAPWWKQGIELLSPLAANFAIGGLLSGCLIFYTKSAVLFVSWPFLLLLAIIFLGNEFFRSYRSHLVFQAVLFFFAVHAYLIFALPLYVNRLGPRVFLESTGLAVLVFALYLLVLSFAGWQRLRELLRYVVLGAAGALALVVLLYFSGLVPPIPLTVKDSGIYQSITHTTAGYEVTYEGSDRWSRFLPHSVEHVSGTPLYAYSAVFAPTAFSADVMHRWEHYDTAKKAWVTESLVAFSLSGGREGGYRGYSQKDNPEPGRWRVSIETTKGQIIGRVAFKVVNVAALPPVRTEVK